MKTLKLQSIGEEVRYLQGFLGKYGFLECNGVFDEKTCQAVINFQKQHDLNADGIVGYRSWEALLFADCKTEEKLAENDFVLAAKLLDVETAVLKAVQQVETGGRGGFFAPGKPAILFEGHVFWHQLQKRSVNLETLVKGNESILYKMQDKKYYKGGVAEYERLEQARKIDREAANASASWGMFQIMGFNYASCGEKSVESFVESMSKSELNQLLLSVRFIKTAGMLPALQKKDWAEFARRYNGPTYAQNKYDEKLASAYSKYKNHSL